jgi:sec-independent protein translocase protein TatA
MFGIGMPELIIILIIILIIFGAGKLPEIGSGIGKGIKNFKKATRQAQEEIEAPDDEKDDDEVK